MYIGELLLLSNYILWVTRSSSQICKKFQTVGAGFSVDLALELESKRAVSIKETLILFRYIRDREILDLSRVSGFACEAYRVKPNLNGLVDVEHVSSLFPNQKLKVVEFRLAPAIQGPFLLSVEELKRLQDYH